MTFTDASQGKALADYVFEELEQAKAGIIKMENEDTTSELVRQFTAEMEKLTEDENCIAASVQISPKAKRLQRVFRKNKSIRRKGRVYASFLKDCGQSFCRGTEDRPARRYFLLHPKIGIIMI